MRNKLLVFFILISSASWSQNLKVLKGQIVAKTREVTGISVTNLSSNRTVVSEEKGLFSITAKTGDTLLFTAVQLQPRKIVLEKEDFDYLTFFVSMNVKVMRLNEILIEKSNITAESLGWVPKGRKTQSQEERAVRR